MKFLKENAWYLLAAVLIVVEIWLYILLYDLAEMAHPGWNVPALQMLAGAPLALFVIGAFLIYCGIVGWEGE